jgi:hypothetical protein
VTFLDSYIVVSPNDVHFGIVAAFDKGIDHVINAGEGGFVFDCMAAYFSIVLDQPSSSVFLGNEEAGRGLW